MRQLKIHLILLLITFTLLFNIERLDFGAENLIDIQTFVYVLAIFITTTILLLPFFSRYRVTVSVSLAFGLYVGCKLVFWGSRPFFGGFYTYVSITEIAFLAIIAIISQRLAQSLDEFQQGFEAMTLGLGGKNLQTVSMASSDIRREITRSRHYLRPFSVIVVEPDQQSFDLALPRIYEELQRSMVGRFARVKLAQAMRQHLRLMDLILEEDESNRFIILCPEVDDQGSAVIVERIQTVMKHAGVKAYCSVATFPQDALTFEGLINQARTKLDSSANTDDIPLQTPNIHPVS